MARLVALTWPPLACSRHRWGSCTAWHACWLTTRTPAHNSCTRYAQVAATSIRALELLSATGSDATAHAALRAAHRGSASGARGAGAGGGAGAATVGAAGDAGDDAARAGVVGGWNRSELQAALAAYTHAQVYTRVRGCPHVSVESAWWMPPNAVGCCRCVYPRCLMPSCCTVHAVTKSCGDAYRFSVVQRQAALAQAQGVSTHCAAHHPTSLSVL